MAKTALWSILVTATARACLQEDPAWTGDGFTASPERGWRAFAGLMSALAMCTPAAVEFLAGYDETRHWLDDIVK